MPIVFADVTITTHQDIYNIGNNIRASASVVHDDEFEGLFKLTISCPRYQLPYFLTPVTLEADYRNAVNVPEVTSTSSMIGECNLIGELLTTENLVVEKEESKSFSVTDELNVTPSNSNISALPGETIKITGDVNEAFGNPASKAVIDAELDGEEFSFDVIDGKFDFSLLIPSNIKSGMHKIELIASDSNDNSGQASIDLDVIGTPKKINAEFSDDIILPGSKTEILVSLFDQADELIKRSVNLDLISPNGDKVFSKVAESNDKIIYEFSQYAEPGSYSLVSTYEDLLSQASIEVSSKEEVKIKYENESVIIENVGNIPFIDELTFTIQSDLKKYLIAKKVNVDPGKILKIDLSKEVPEGTYKVLTPLKDAITPITEKIDESLSDLLSENQNLLADDVAIHDNRPLHKKVGSSLSSITGDVIGSDGVFAKNSFLAPLILIAIVLMIVFRYAGKPLRNLFKKKDKENNQNNENKEN